LFYDPPDELAADDAAMEERVAHGEPTFVVEQREPRRGAAAARRAVDLAVGEHRHVALGERRFALFLPEDDAVHVPKLRLARMDDLVPRFELGLDRPPELDQARQLRRLDPLWQG